MQAERRKERKVKDNKVYEEERKKTGPNKNPRGIYTPRAKAPQPTTP